MRKYYLKQIAFFGEERAKERHEEIQRQTNLEWEGSQKVNYTREDFEVDFVLKLSAPPLNKDGSINGGAEYSNPYRETTRLEEIIIKEIQDDDGDYYDVEEITRLNPKFIKFVKKEIEDELSWVNIEDDIWDKMGNPPNADYKGE